MANYGEIRTPKFYINLFDYIMGNYKVGTPFIREMGYDNENYLFEEGDIVENKTLISASSFYHRNAIRILITEEVMAVDIVYPFLEPIPLEIFRDCNFVALLQELCTLVNQQLFSFFLNHNLHSNRSL